MKKFFALLLALLLLMPAANAATSFSSNVCAPKPTPGDPSSQNTWGALLNTGADIFDAVTSAADSISVAGNSNVILSFSCGTLDQTDAAHFTFTGVLTGNITVFWPNARDRMFSVTNSTTGAFTLTLAVNNGSGSPAGTTQTIVQGTTQLFIDNGTDILPRVTTGVTNVTQQIFTSSGTYTPTAGMKYCIVEMVAGGAGGWTPSANITGGSGGGEYAKGIFTATQIGASQTVTVGLGGTGDTTAGAGGTTSLGSLLTAVGGSPAARNQAPGGAGGTGGTGAGIHIPGGNGTAALQQSSATWNGGYGGASYFGFQAVFSSIGVTGPSTLYGNGGTAGFTSNSGMSTFFGIGGAGAPGVVIITEYQ